MKKLIFAVIIFFLSSNFVYAISISNMSSNVIIDGVDISKYAVSSISYHQDIGVTSILMNNGCVYNFSSSYDEYQQILNVCKNLSPAPTMQNNNPPSSIVYFNNSVPMYYREHSYPCYNRSYGRYHAPPGPRPESQPSSNTAALPLMPVSDMCPVNNAYTAGPRVPVVYAPNRIIRCSSY